METVVESVPRGRGRPPGFDKHLLPRNREMAEAFINGATLEEVAGMFGLSRQRVQQVLKQQGIGRTDGGDWIAKVGRHREKAKLRDDRYLHKWGHTWPEHKVLLTIGRRQMSKGISRARTPIAVFVRQKTNMTLKHPKGLWQLNLKDWWDCWMESKRWPYHGRGAGKYCMVRRDISKPWQKGNIVIMEFTYALVHARGDRSWV